MTPSDIIPLTGIDMTLSGVVSLIVILIVIGALVPRSVLKMVQKEAERWRSAAETERGSRERLQSALQDQSMEMAKMNLHSMESLASIANKNKGKGDGTPTTHTTPQDEGEE